jgi:hypothetical protein
VSKSSRILLNHDPSFIEARRTLARQLLKNDTYEFDSTKFHFYYLLKQLIIYLIGRSDLAISAGHDIFKRSVKRICCTTLVGESLTTNRIYLAES